MTTLGTHTIVWNSIIDNSGIEQHKAAAIRNRTSCIVHIDVHTKKAVTTQYSGFHSWSCLMFEGIETTTHTDQINEVHVYACGSLIATLKGQC
jgi:hypothetical protein